MRDDDPDEADEPADRHGGRGAQRGGDHHDEPHAGRAGAEGLGLVVADGEHVEAPGREQQHGERHDGVGQQEADVVATRRR